MISINSLTTYLMPSAKNNLTMDKATGLISLLLTVASAHDVPFYAHFMDLSFPSHFFSYY